MKLYPYTDVWESNDAHANFKADVAQNTVADPLPAVYELSQRTGIPVTCLIRYILAKYTTSNGALLATVAPQLQLIEEEICPAEVREAALLPA
ncbi:hypothetical protein LBMAG37_20380 [Anaerolineae bacterium]|nr:hypothetical protein LBMAG37_20380 [Anaerolineae bacterium]